MLPRQASAYVRSESTLHSITLGHAPPRCAVPRCAVLHSTALRYATPLATTPTMPLYHEPFVTLPWPALYCLAPRHHRGHAAPFRARVATLRSNTLLRRLHPVDGRPRPCCALPCSPLATLQRRCAALFEHHAQLHNCDSAARCAPSCYHACYGRLSRSSARLPSTCRDAALRGYAALSGRHTCSATVLSCTLGPPYCFAPPPPCGCASPCCATSPPRLLNCPGAMLPRSLPRCLAQRLRCAAAPPHAALRHVQSDASPRCASTLCCIVLPRLLAALRHLSEGSPQLLSPCDNRATVHLSRSLKLIKIL